MEICYWSVGSGTTGGGTCTCRVDVKRGETIAVQCHELLSVVNAFSTLFQFLNYLNSFVSHRDASLLAAFAQPPNLRTVGIERITQAGIDFVVKRGSMVADAMSRGQELAFLHTQGQFLPGQSAEQWRGEGHCLVLPLGEVLDEVPHFIITSMVGSKRIATESASGWPVDESSDESLQRSAVENRSHLTEVMQRTRLDLENGDVTLEELNDCIRAFRLQPDRIECMWASPDSSVLWDRWEWQREPGECPEGTIAWQKARNLVPH